MPNSISMRQIVTVRHRIYRYYANNANGQREGAYRIISATDLEATFRTHDDELILG
jgi:hypothetical protein